MDTLRRVAGDPEDDEEEEEKKKWDDDEDEEDDDEDDEEPWQVEKSGANLVGPAQLAVFQSIAAKNKPFFGLRRSFSAAKPGF